MRKKVIRIMIILVIAFLISFYFIEILFNRKSLFFIYAIVCELCDRIRKMQMYTIYAIKIKI